MTLKVDKHDLNSNTLVQGIQIALSQLIKMLLIVSDERRIYTDNFYSGTVQQSKIWHIVVQL